MWNPRSFPFQLAALILVGAILLMGSGGIQSAYNLIEANGTPVTKAQTLNFSNTSSVTWSCSTSAGVTGCQATSSGGGSGAGGGITVFSGSTLTLLGTQYLAIGGGAAVASSEATVEVESPTAAQISNLSVQVSAALGLGASAVFTWRDGGSSEALTCTISGASQTSCTDTTHSFNAAQGDELDIQVVTTGTPAAVTLVIASAFGALSNLNPTFTISNATSTGTTVNTLTKLTGAPSTAVITATSDTGGAVGITTAGAGTSGTATITTAGKISCVFDGGTTAGHYVQLSSMTAGNCTDAGATYPTSGQVVGRVLSTNASSGTYQIDLFPSEIEGSGGGGGSFSVAPPYYVTGGNSYVGPFAFEVTKPTAANFSWSNQGGASNTTNTNGDIYLVGTQQSGDEVRVYTQAVAGSTPYSYTAAVVFHLTPQDFNSMGFGLFASSTNQTEWIGLNNNASIAPPNLAVARWNSYTSFNAAQNLTFVTPLPIWFFKVRNDGTNLTWSWSPNGINFETFYTEAVSAFFTGTITGVGFMMDGNSTNSGALNAMDVLSISQGT